MKINHPVVQSKYFSPPALGFVLLVAASTLHCLLVQLDGQHVLPRLELLVPLLPQITLLRVGWRRGLGLLAGRIFFGVFTVPAPAREIQ